MGHSRPFSASRYNSAEVIDQDGDTLVDEFSDTDDGSNTAAIESLYDQLIDWLDNRDNIFCEIDEAGCFLMDYDKLLDKITARKARDNDLDLDDEYAVREWYYREKTA